MARIFISYSRKDVDFARQWAGADVWIDLVGVYIAMDIPNPVIAILKVESKQLTRLTIGQDEDISWSPDGRQIVFFQPCGSTK